MHNQWALMALAMVVILVLVLSELLPLVAGAKHSLDRFDFGKAKRREKQLGGY